METTEKPDGAERAWEIEYPWDVEGLQEYAWRVAAAKLGFKRGLFADADSCVRVAIAVPEGVGFFAECVVTRLFPAWRPPDPVRLGIDIVFGEVNWLPAKGDVLGFDWQLADVSPPAWPPETVEYRARRDYMWFDIGCSAGPYVGVRRTLRCLDMRRGQEEKGQEAVAQRIRQWLDEFLLRGGDVLWLRYGVKWGIDLLEHVVDEGGRV